MVGGWGWRHWVFCSEGLRFGFGLGGGGITLCGLELVDRVVVVLVVWVVLKKALEGKIVPRRGRKAKERERELCNRSSG